MIMAITLITVIPTIKLVINEVFIVFSQETVLVSSWYLTHDHAMVILVKSHAIQRVTVYSML